LTREENEIRIAANCVRFFHYIEDFDNPPEVLASDKDIQQKIEAFVSDLFKHGCAVDYFGILERYGVSDKIHDNAKEVIASANMELLWAILTLYIRAERHGGFMGGVFPGVIMEGYVVDILKRLRELNESRQRIPERDL
jgi:hypothetical protein